MTMIRLVVILLAITTALPVTAPAQPGQTLLPEGLEQLDLETAQRIALQANPDMAAAMSRIEQARARVRQALGSWWPSVDLSLSGDRTRLSDRAYERNLAFSQMSGQSTDRTTDNSSASLQATWVLFDGFYRSFRRQQAEFNRDSLVAARRDAQRLLINAVAEAFFNAQLAQTRVDIASADQTFYRSQLKDARNRFEAGAGSWGDVLNIRVQCNTAETNLLLNQRQLEAAAYGLASLMGLESGKLPPHVKLAPLDTSLQVDRQVTDPETLIKEALANRPDIRRLELARKEAEALAGQAKAPFYPKVQIVGAVNGVRQGDIGLTGEDFGDMIGINMAWNLFAGGSHKARVFEARQRIREIDFSLISLRNNVASEIRQDLALLAAAREQVELQRKSVDLVRENRDLAQNEYEAGEASLIRLNEAQRDLSATYGRLAQALVEYQRARHRLLAATGRNLEAFSPSGRTSTAQNHRKTIRLSIGTLDVVSDSEHRTKSSATISHPKTLP